MTATGRRKSSGAAFASNRPGHSRSAPPLQWLKGVGLLSASALAAINAWTGAPLLAIWVGSRFEGWVGGSGTGGGTTMRAVFVVVGVLAVLELVLTVALGRLSAAYDKLTGRPASARHTSPWLRSMRGEREEMARKKAGISGLERVVVISVVAAALAFEIWFFFFAGSPLPSQ